MKKRREKVIFQNDAKVQRGGFIWSYIPQTVSLEEIYPKNMVFGGVKKRRKIDSKKVKKF